MPDSRLRVSLISLGCPKNLIDSEVMVGKLADGPFELQSEPDGADVVVVNTCGFIAEARAESIDTICEMLELKNRGQVKGVVVAGCMVRRYSGELMRELPDVDAFLDISDYTDAPEVFRRIRERHDRSSPATSDALEPFAPAEPFLGGGGAKTATVDLDRARLTLPHTAYLRVSEGCDRKCAFCAIPLIRGKQKSKPIEVLVEEARGLAAQGVVELNLVGEETTAFGSDLGMRYGEGIAPLLRALSEVDGIRWIRLLYAHPASFRPSLVDEIASNDKVVPYVDVPVQHFDGEVLKRMKRGTPPEKIESLIESLRARVPGIAIRTTIVVGFPGETEKRFENLYQFLGRAKFDRLGCFTYSREEGTSAFELAGRVPARAAAERRRKVMLLQRRVMRARHKALVGQTLPVLIDTVTRDGAIARTEGDAPQIDSKVRVKGEGLTAGSIVDVTVTGLDGYDLDAKVVGVAAER